MEIIEGKHKQQQSTKSSRSPSPEPAREGPGSDGEFRPIIRTPPPSRAGPPPSPPVPTRPIAPVAPEPSGPQPLMPCQVCGRTFLPQSLAKHVKICEKMTVKKRKTFDSSRQRREGTDLAQFLPKNFGLPENSPFLEKSPPATAKPAPKPKVQSVRTAISKPVAELQKCPHCNRAFGVRAFERHVEWCADKAKILPAAPAQPPPHIADAKQRLNARTQYKAPPVRGRRSSQTRDKSSNSRSASVESSRGISPPREYGDYRHGRTRASESGSSNDCHDDTSPHVPVIRNSRNTQNSSSGDANVKARQARLARDLSNSRAIQVPQASSLQQTNTDPKINKTQTHNKVKNKTNVKKQQQLKILEEMASKYRDKNIEKIEELNSTKKKAEKSLIPIPKHKTVKKTVPDPLDIEKPINVNNNKTKISKKNPNPQKDSYTDSKNEPPKEKPKPVKFRRKDKNKLVKENSMSLDSLEGTPPSTSRNCQSIDITTGLQCVPCVIHENTEQHGGKRTKLKPKSFKKDVSEDEIKLLYKNPTIVNSCVMQIKENYDINESKGSSLLTNSRNSIQSVSDNFVLESNGSSNAMNETKHQSISSNDFINNGKPTTNKCEMFNQESKLEDEHYLSTEHLEQNYEHDISNEISDASGENKIYPDTENNIECKYGSGETYTKFTEDPSDFDEFMNITDKLIDDQYEERQCEMEVGIHDLHTPRTNSIEAINNETKKEVIENKTLTEQVFSDTFEELKSNFQELLQHASNNDILNKSQEINQEAINRQVCDLEHITVYERKVKDNKRSEVVKNSEVNDVEKCSEFKLPTIQGNNKSQKTPCNKNDMLNIYKPKSNKKYKLLGEQNRKSKDNQTYICDKNNEDSSDNQSISSEAPPLKLPRIENNARLDDHYDPFVSAARQMKELMSSDTNISKNLSQSSKDLNRTLPILRPTKEKNSYNPPNSKMMKDTLNKSYQKTPTLQRMKSFGSTNNDNNTFGGRCSSFRVNRNDKKSSQKLNTTFTKSSKENISTVDKSYFNRNSNLNRSFSSYTASSYSTPKPKDKIPKIATSMYHSFQRTTIKQPLKLDKIKRDDAKKDFVSLDAILADDNSSVMTDSTNYIDPRLINENDNLPINVNTILNNPDIISSMESLLTTENLPAKFDSFSSSNINNNVKTRNGFTNSSQKLEKIENNNNVNKISVPIIDNLNTQYDKLMSSLEQSITSKTSVRDDESLCEDFDLEEFMTSFDEEVIKHKVENKRTCSSTTRVVKQSELADSNRTSERNSISSSPKVRNGMIPVNKSMSLNFSSNMANENIFPSSVKRSTSLLDSIQKKSVSKLDSAKSRQKVDQLEQDLMQSLKDFDRLYASEKNDNYYTQKETPKHTTVSLNGTTKRDTRGKIDRKTKKEENISNGNYTPNGKTSNDSAYSSLNRISPSKLSLCTSKEPNGPSSLGQAPAGSDSGSHKDEIRSVSSEEFLAMERSAELDEPLPKLEVNAYKESESHTTNEKRVSSRPASRRSPWHGQGELSSSGSEASFNARRDSAPLPRLSRFCHECGTKFSVETAKFCIECGVKRLVI